MSEIKDRGVVTLDKDSVLAGPRGGEDVDGEARDNGKLVDTAASRRKAAVHNPEVSARPKRRHFSAAYKARVVEEAEDCTESGEIGALLRREGLYSSQLSAWRKLYRAGALQALRDDKRGRKATKHPLEDKVRRLERENAHLEKKLEKAHLIIDVQGKVAGLLGLSLEDGTNS